MVKTRNVEGSDGWSTVQQVTWYPMEKVRWEKPPFNCLYINTDGRFLVDEVPPYAILAAGFGLVVRDHQGKPLLAIFASMEGVSPLVHELQGIQAALELIQTEKYDEIYDEVTIYTDCSDAVNYVNEYCTGRSGFDYKNKFTDLLDSIKSLPKPRGDDWLKHIKRQGNYAADCAAKLPTICGHDIQQTKGTVYRLDPDQFPQILNDKIDWDKKGRETGRRAKRPVKLHTRGNE